MSDRARLVTARELFDRPDVKHLELVRGVAGCLLPQRHPSGARRIPEQFILGAPDLAVEILSPGDSWSEIEEKVREYLAGGVRLVWLVDPRERRVTVRYPDRPPRVLATDGVLDGEDVVPGFSLPLAGSVRREVAFTHADSPHCTCSSRADGHGPPRGGPRAAVQPDSAKTQIRTVLRGFYSNMESGNWDALAAYVLSPKLLERRGAAGDSQLVARDRTRTRARHRSRLPRSNAPRAALTMIDQADIRLDADWAEVSVPRCRDGSAGTDEFRLLYFEQRWRFIYTDLFEAPANVSTGR